MQKIKTNKKFNYYLSFSILLSSSSCLLLNKLKISGSWNINSKSSSEYLTLYKFPTFFLPFLLLSIDSINPTSIRQFHLHLLLRLHIYPKKTPLPPHSTPCLSTPISIIQNSHPKKINKSHSCFQVQLCKTVNYVPNWIKPHGCIEFNQFMTNQQIGPATLTNNSWISTS